MAQESRLKPATPLWSPGNPLGAGMTWGTIFDAPGASQHNYVAPGVSDVSVVAGTMGTGVFGRELQTNGTNQYARVVGSPAIQISAPFTVAILLRTTPSVGKYKYPLALNDASDALTYAFSTGATAKPRALVKQSNGSIVTAEPASYTWDSNYHLLAMTYTPSGALTLYIDGIVTATATGNGTIRAYSSSYVLCLGSGVDSTTAGDYYWPGAIAASYVWSRALSSRDQLRLAQDPFSPFRRRPCAWLLGSQYYPTVTLGAGAQATSASLSAAVSIPGTLGASSQAATTSLAATVNLTATLGATAAEATVDLEGFWGVPLEITATATAAHTSLRVRWGRTPPASDQTDLIRVGLSLLTQTLKATASQPVTYVRGLDSVDVRATFGRKLLKLDDGAGGIRMEWTDMDFLIPSADLVIGGESITPQRGDRVFMLAGENVQEFEVMPFGSDPAWIWSDPHQSMFRIHAKHIGSEPYSL
mgnify:FL=1